MLPRDARLTCPGEEVWTLPRDPGWREVTRSHPEVSVVREAGGGPPGARARTLFCFGALFHDVIKTQLRVDGAGFLCQGDVANPKAETADRMLLRPLCNNVTKILMIKSHNLRFRIKGFDVCLVLSLHTALQLSTCM